VKPYTVGDRFNLLEEDIHGGITNILRKEEGEPFALVVAMDDGQWATIDLSKITSLVLH